MTTKLERAIASVATLPEADQEKIGQRLLEHVFRLKALRRELAKGLHSLDLSRSRPLDIEMFMRRARDRVGEPKIK